MCYVQHSPPGEILHAIIKNKTWSAQDYRTNLVTSIGQNFQGGSTAILWGWHIHSEVILRSNVWASWLIIPLSKTGILTSIPPDMHTLHTLVYNPGKFA